MLPLRAFLLIKESCGDWRVSVHRDFESTIETWRAAYHTVEVTGVIHVGFTRSDTFLFEDLSIRFAGKMLLTAPARYAFARIGPCAPEQAGSIEGIPVYVALSGWGYETSAEELCLASELPTEPQYRKDALSQPELDPNCEWLNMFAKIFPQDAEMVRLAGIINDESYIELESKIEERLRIKIGRYRFHCLLEDINHNSPEEVVGIAPPWILSTPIDHIELSVRSHNCLNSKGIKFIRELVDYTDSQLMHVKYLGRKSVVDIAMAIITAIGNRPEAVDLADSQHKKGADALDQRQTKSLKHLKQPTRVQATESATFGDALLGLFKPLNRRVSMVMQQRMGFGTKPVTLEEIGDLLGVSRERVRQIEMKICNKEKSKPFWSQRVEEPIKRALENRDTPLPVVALDIIDPWFANINKLEDPLKFVLEKFCSGELGVVKINGFSYLSAIDQEEWDSAVKEASGVLEHGVSHKWKQSEAKHAVGSILPKKAHEFCDELFFTASTNAMFSMVEGSDEPILTGFGRGADAYVEAAMFESDRPLHFTEIADRIVVKGREIDTRRVHNVAAEIGFLYGRGTYGLMKHYPLDEEETQEITAEVEDIIASGPKGRQWHCSELNEILCEHGLDMDGRLTPYVINIGLKRSKTLVDLRRLVWAAGRTATRMTAGDRIEIRQAIESLLRIEGKPLSGPDIRKRLLKEGRGVGEYFQIFNEGNIIRIGKNYWGLVDRDIPFSVEQQKMVTEILEKTLYRTQKGIHKTEIHEALKEMSGIESFATVDPALFISIALRTGRMRYAVGNYLCMSDWSDARRPTAEEAVRIALEEAGSEGLLTKDLKEIASKIMGVEISSDNLYARLSAIGARHNADTDRWQIMTGKEHLDIS